MYVNIDNYATLISDNKENDEEREGKRTKCKRIHFSGSEETINIVTTRQ